MTDIPYRYEYLCKFVNFTKDDVATLHSLAPILGPMVPAVVDAVYVKLFTFSNTKGVFLKRNEGFNGRLENRVEEISHDSEQIKFRKDMLSKYLVRLVTAPYDANMVNYLSWVGKVHTDKGGSKSIDVPLGDCLALLTYVEDFLIDAILGVGADRETEKKAIHAVNKLLWIQADLFAVHYLPSKEEKALLAAHREGRTKGARSGCKVDWAFAAVCAGAASVATWLVLKK
jgi:hypothetical protein